VAGFAIRSEHCSRPHFQRWRLRRRSHHKARENQESRCSIPNQHPETILFHARATSLARRYRGAKMRNLVVLLLGAAFCVMPAERFDVVYGATSGRAIAAIAAAKERASVAFLEPGRHVGGMLTGGVGRTDMDRQESVIGGYSREFFERAGKHYGNPSGGDSSPASPSAHSTNG
jgi:hypothetical protein